MDAGTVKLTDELPVKNEFKSLVDGSPFSIGLEDNDGPTVAHLGQQVPIAFLAREMIVRSSNLATNILLTFLGPAEVQKFTDELGAPTVKVRRCIEDTKAFEKGLNNETDAAGMGTVMEAVVRTPRLSAAAKEKAWEILIGQTFNEEIPAGLHPQSGAVVAHKTGNMSTSKHDAAIDAPAGRARVRSSSSPTTSARTRRAASASSLRPGRCRARSGRRWSPPELVGKRDSTARAVV